MANWLEQATVVEPIGSLQRGELDRIPIAPGTTTVHHFGLLQAVGRLGQGVVVRKASSTKTVFIDDATRQRSNSK